MVPVDLLEAELPQTFNLLKKKKKEKKYAKHNEVKHNKNEVCLYWIITQSIVQLLSWVQLFKTPWTAACQASLSFTISEFAQIHVHWVNDAI